MTLLFWLLALIAGVYLYSHRYLKVDLHPQVRSGLTGIRLILLALLAWWAFEHPTYRDQVSISEPAKAIILLDDSRSMSFPEDPVAPSPQQSRWEAARTFLSQQGVNYLRDANLNLDVRYLSNPSITVATDVVSLVNSLNLTPHAPQTDLTAAVTAIKPPVGQHPVQVLLFSDGQQAADRPPPSLSDIPSNLITYWTFGIGPEILPRNVNLERIDGPDRMRSGIQSRYELVGHCDAVQNDPIAVHLDLIHQVERDGAWIADVIAYSTDFQIVGNESGFSVSTTIEGPETTGRYILNATATLAGDLIPQDNYQEMIVEVVPARDPVLILTGTPTWELRYLKRALEDDPTLAVTSGWWREGSVRWFMDRYWVELRRSEVDRTDLEESQLPFPKDEHELWRDLNRWSVIVLYRLSPRDLDEFSRNRLIEVLENGGRVLSIFGDENPVSEPIAPFGVLALNWNPEPFLAKLSPDIATTSLGPALETILEGNPPPLSGSRITGKIPPGARSLLVRQNNPLDTPEPIILEVPVGLGRAVLSFTESFWRWDLHNGNGAKLWRFLIHRILRPEHLVPDRLIIQPSSPEVGDRVRFRFDVTPDTASEIPQTLPIRINTPEGLKLITLVASQYNPNRLEAEMVVGSVGSYRATAESQAIESVFEVVMPDRESRNVTQDRLTLERLAKATGGAYAAKDEWLNQLQSIPTEPFQFDIERQRPWASRWWIIILISSLLSIEWLWRQKEGLP